MKWPEVSLSSALAEADVFVDGDWIESKDQDPDGDVRLIQLADIGDGEYLDKSSRFLTSMKAEELRCTYIEAGDVLVARMPDPLGRACIFPGDLKRAVTVVDVCIIRPNREQHDSRWLRHCINSPMCRNQIADYASGTTRSRISRGNLGKIKFPLPPLPEQRRIAEVLDRAEALRAKRREALAHLDTLTQSIFLEMFGDPTTNIKGWQVQAIEEISMRVTKGESPHWQGFSYEAAGVRFVTSENVGWGKMILNADKFISEKFNMKLGRSQLRENDLLVNLVGASIGRACLTHGSVLPANVNQAVAVVSLDTAKVIPCFVLEQLLTPQVQKRLLGGIVEAARANISLTNIRGLALYVPPLPLQQEFARRVAAVDKLKETQRASLRELDALFASLQHRAFRGEL